MKVQRIRSSLLIAVTILAGSTLHGQLSPVQTLIELVTSPGFQDSDEAEDRLFRAAVDAGPLAVAPLRKLVGQSGGEQRLLALFTLCLIGRQEAIDIVREQYERGDEELRQALAFALGSEDSAENRKALVRLLDGDPRDHWEAVDSAALSLGILRADDATWSLRELAAQAEPGSRDTAVLALQWIEKGFWPVDARSVGDDDRLRAIAAVLRNGVPHTPDTAYYLDQKGGGLWRFGSDGWAFTSGAPDDRSPNAELDVFMSSDGLRALVSVDIHCGLWCGYGYAYVLRKEGDAWRVQGLMQTWVA